MTRRFKFILMLAILIGFLAGFVPSERAQAYWLTYYVAETSGTGEKWNGTGYNGHSYWYRQYCCGVYGLSWSSWYSAYHTPAAYHYWSAYIPNAQSNSKAWVYYTVSISRTVTINQQSYNNTWVSLGSNSTLQNQSSVCLDNGCVSGTICTGLEVIWDETQYRRWVD